MQYWLRLSVGVFLLACLAASANAADIDEGKADFKQCALCHSTEPGKNRIGPSLFAVVGRKAGSLADYKYSEAMKNFGRIWDAPTLDAYLTDPRQMIPGTKMIFAGIKDKEERGDLIAYLETLK